MSLTELEIHFEEMQNIGNQLSELAAGLQRLADMQGREAVMEVKQVWQSENAAVFVKAGLQRLHQVKETAEDLRKLSEDIQKRAKQIYEVEKWNILKAQTRIY